MTTPWPASNARPYHHQSQFRRICINIVEDLQKAFPDVKDFVSYYEYNPDDLDTKPFSIIVAPASISLATEPDWGTGDAILEGIVDIFISYRYRTSSEADTCLYWAEQIFGWAHYKDIDGTQYVTRPVELEYISLSDNEDNPDISVLTIKVSLSTIYTVKAEDKEGRTGNRLQFLSINQEVTIQYLHRGFLTHNIIRWALNPITLGKR